MKIAHIINTLDAGGAEKMTIELCQELSGNLDTLDLVVLKYLDTIFDVNGLNIIYLGSFSLYNPYYLIKLIPVIKKYDLIHVHLFPALYWVVLAKLFSFSKVKFIYTEHSTENRRRGSLAYKYIDRFFYATIDHVACISEGAKRRLSNHIRRVGNISVVNNAINLKKFKKKEILEYNFFKSSFRVVQVSSFRTQKDQMTLIKALKLLPLDIKLILVGDGFLRKLHEDYVIDKGLSNRVLFLGNRSDIPELLSYCDVLVQSSHYEGFGLTSVEGMAANKPVIASNVDGLNEVVGEYGLLFEKGNHEELAKLILRLYMDKDYYNNIRDKCFERAGNFSIDKMAENYLAIYHRVLKS